MQVIQPNCRAQFTASDVDFILNTLRRDETDTSALTSLLSDPDARDELLDDENLFQAILEHPGCTSISHHLYFYILVRKVFREAGIEDRVVTDYVAELLAEFYCAQRVRHPLSEPHLPLDYLVDMVTAMQQADQKTRFLIQAHMGNITLFLAGVFPGHLRARTRRRGAPPLEFYEGVGMSSFREAANHGLADQLKLRDVFHTLSDTFRTSRLALNEMSDRLVSLGHPEINPELLIQP